MSHAEHPKVTIRADLVEPFIIGLEGWAWESKRATAEMNEEEPGLALKDISEGGFIERYRYRRAERRLLRRARLCRAGEPLTLETRDTYEQTVVTWALSRCQRAAVDVQAEHVGNVMEGADRINRGASSPFNIAEEYTEVKRVKEVSDFFYATAERFREDCDQDLWRGR